MEISWLRAACPSRMEIEKHGAEVLVADFDAQPLEGYKRSVYYPGRSVASKA